MAQDRRIQRALKTLAAKYGREVEQASRGGHYRLTKDGAPPVVASGSPKCIDNMLKAVERDLRRVDG